MAEYAELRDRYLSGLPRIACPADNDGFPTCMRDGGECGYSPELKRSVCTRLDPGPGQLPT